MRGCHVLLLKNETFAFLGRCIVSFSCSFLKKWELIEQEEFTLGQQHFKALQPLAAVCSWCDEPITAKLRGPAINGAAAVAQV